ncbi:MAG: DNA methyltransferase [Chloroflexota bacterium]
MATNALFYGDNLVWLRDHKYFPDESVDLIYLDPPFNSKADYNLLFNEPGQRSKSQAQIKAFDDSWHWDSEASAIALNELAQHKPQIAEFLSWLSRQGKAQESMAAYLSMMAVRLIELQRVLNLKGSIYVHCDSTASHYLKMLMDVVFGVQHFRNDIRWKRQPVRGAKSISQQFARTSDSILFYTKTSEATWNRQFKPYNEGYVKSKFTYQDKSGRRFRIGDIGDYSEKSIVEFRKLGKIYDYPSGKVGLKRYLDEQKGEALGDFWTEPASINAQAAERLGYPTQKPQALLERIILASSNEGDLVLDPFCGCGTTIDAAQKLNRHWLGIDVTWLAIGLVEKRLRATYGSKVDGKFEVHGKPYDVASAQALANKSKKEFEIWAVTSVGAAPREHDGGVDGIMGFVEKNKKIQTIIVQVKGGDALNPGMVRDLIGTVKKEGAAIGLLVTLKEPTAGMNTLAVHSESYKSELWDKEFPSIQIRTVEELFAGKAFDLPPTKSLLKNAQLAKEQGQQISQDI